MKTKRRKMWESALALILALSISLPLMLVGGTEVSAGDIKYIDYRALIDLYKREHGVEFDTPTSKFDVLIEGRAPHFVEPTDAEDDYPHEVRRNMPVVKDAIKVGQKFSVRDKSTVGSGSAINRWEWQIYYRDKDDKIYESYTFSQKNLSNLPAPKKEGHVDVFLNVADNYVLQGNKKHTNASSHGNWRTEFIRDGAITGNMNLAVKGWYFTATRIKVTNDEMLEDVILTEMRLIDKKTGKELETFKRTYDPLDPLNEKKQKIIRSSTSPKNASTLSREDDYLVKAKYKFVSFKEGKFNVDNPSTMNDKQKKLSTVVDKNQLLAGESYDENALQDGKFNSRKTVNSISTRMKNTEEREFQWDYRIPKDVKKYIKLSGVIPEGLFPKEKNQNPGNDWGVVFAQIAQNDMGLEDIKIFDESGLEVQSIERGKKYKANVITKHVKGKDEIGKDKKRNPKATVIYRVTEQKSKKHILPNNKRQTDKILKPKQKIVMPKSNYFSTVEDTIRVCATIDKKHEELGYNYDPSNDTICKEFKVRQNDIGLTDLKLYQGGREVDFLEPNKPYTVDVVAQHIYGKDIMGTDSKRNPKVKVHYKVMEPGNKVILPKNSKQTNKLLKPKKSITMPKSDKFTSSEGFVRVCASIDEKHKLLGYNEDKSNDVVCKNFEMIKNYSIVNFSATPSGVNFGKGSNVLSNIPVTFLFTVGNETNKGVPEKLPSSIEVVIKQGSKKIWGKNVSVAPGKQAKFTASANVNLRTGDNNFTVEVNPRRTVKEFKASMKDPYIDNERKLNIRGTRYAKCQECDNNNKRLRNEWKERWEWYEQRGNVQSSTYDKCHRYKTVQESYCKGGWGRNPKTGKVGCLSWGTKPVSVCAKWERNIPYEYCSITYKKEWSEVKNYYENFKINQVRFGSKLHQDLIGIRKKPIHDGGKAKIKAGYGFELEVDLLYKTNRNIEPLLDPYEDNYYRGDKYGKYPSGYCNFRTRSPGVTKVHIPDHIYVEMPYSDMSGENVCYILTNYSDNGEWHNNIRTFRLPPKKSPTGQTQNRIYINKDAKPNYQDGRSLPIKIVTPRPDKPDRFYGYYPENQVGNGKKPEGVFKNGNYLHDCHTIFVEIHPGDDIKSHITQ